MKNFLPCSRHVLVTYFREDYGEKEKPPTFSLAAKRFRAFDLSCRACGACGAGAGSWAWIPGRGTFGFSPPTSDFRSYFKRLDGRKNPYAKVVDFELLETPFGPEAPDPDLAHFQIKA